MSREFWEDHPVIKAIVLIVLAIAIVFLQSWAIMWGWNVIAPHLNAPLFGYWEIFAVRVALGFIIGMFKRKIEFGG